MSKRKRRIEKIVSGQAQKSEDAERISNILNRKAKKGKLGPPSDKKNPYLGKNKGIDLIELFPEYENKKKRKI